MEISKKALFITLIVNILLLAIGTICIVYMKYSILALSLFLGALVFIFISSVFLFKYGRDVARKE